MTPKLKRSEAKYVKNGSLQSRNDPNVYNCLYCRRSFSNFQVFRKHACSGCKAFNCDICKEQFSEYSRLSKHISNHFSDHSYCCELCGEELSKLKLLKLHILKHEGIEYRCEKCNKIFTTSRLLEKHKCIVFDCHECGKVFPTKQHHTAHMRRHSNVLAQNFKCRFCSIGFVKETTYQAHIYKLNCSKAARNYWIEQYIPTKCRFCSETFSTEEDLISHCFVWHDGERIHQCRWCEESLASYTELVAHVNHHNTLKFNCTQCGKQYASQEGYRRHRMKHSNTGLKCKYCESMYLCEKRLVRHVEKCKKNPESGYGPSEQRTNKEGKQRRQLHWESRIIIKKVRNVQNQSSESLDNPDVCSLSQDEDSQLDDRHGWFDDYYRIEEDEINFGGTAAVEEKSEVDIVELPPVPPPPPVPQSPYESEDSSENESGDDVNVDVEYNHKQCRLCGVSYSLEFELIHHFIKTHPGVQAHKCPYCEHTSPLFAQLKEHLKTHGIGLGVHHCGNCSKAFKSEQRMKAHYPKCIGDVEGKAHADVCRKCGRVYQTKYGYKRHKMVCKVEKRAKELMKVEELKHEDNSNENVSELEDFKEPASFSIDIKEAEDEKATIKETTVSVKTIEEPPKDSFPCRLCPAKFQYLRGIVMHFKESHPSEKALICHVCGIALADKLKEHLKTHGIGEEFVCELCGKRFNQKFVGKIHELWHQGIEYKCELCKQKFLNKEKMDKHIEERRCKNRASLMLLPCDICGKFYKSKFGLNNHHLTHTPRDLRPVKNRMNCEYCGKWFESNNGLQRHRRIHTGEKPYYCRFCPRAFAQEGNCKAHERIHTGEAKPRKKKPSKIAEPAVITSAYQPNQLVFTASSGFSQ